MQSNECSNDVDFKQKLFDKIKQFEENQELQRKAEIEKFCEENRVKVKENAKARLDILNAVKCKFVDVLKKVPFKQVSEEKKKVTCFNGNKVSEANGIVQEASTFILSKSIQLPIMFLWAPVQRNVLVEDEEFLYNFPNLGDEIFEQDPSFFTEELATEAFKGKIHGDEKEERSDDKAMMELIKSLSEAEPFAQDSNDTPLPTQMIFEAVSEVYPNKGAPDELRLAYGKHLNEACASQKSTVSIESETAEPVSPERYLSSYTKKFCRRCFTYGCLTHEKEEFSRPDRKKFEDKPEKKKCDADCYMQLSDHPEPGTSALVSDEEWNVHDQSFFRVLQISFLDNFCAIARGMQNKTCKQVSEFAQKDENQAAEQEPSSSGVRHKKPSKKGKFLNKILAGRVVKDASQNDERDYSPCDHDGPCKAGCVCFDRNTFCEKFCKCPPTCKKRFPGCRCKGQCLTNLCSCYIGYRECDPDICQCNMERAKQCECEPAGCKCQKVCENVRIQRGLRKRLLLAPSDIKGGGWGMFIRDGAKRHDFIYEYCGEKITIEEASRREVIYKKTGCSFIFNLNKDYVIDATRKGNKIRFANHSNKPNCYVKIIMVNGDHRIGVFAKRQILQGEELFLHYGDNNFVGIK